MTCSFIFCLHNHQPVGNFEHIFSWAYKDCYYRTLRILSEYPEFRFALHTSGPLLEWMEQHGPEYLDLLGTMHGRGQVEIIGGGFYEPIFSIISEEDIRGQIGMMQNFWKKRLGVVPKGFWTAERVWDPEIPRLVSGFDLEYTILDDNHFRYAGIEERDLHGYYLTERLYHPLKVFPIDRFLRYAIPFRLPEETINYFRERAGAVGDAGETAFVYGDDGEKFGVWPGTAQWVFEENWLRNFIEAVLRESWIKMTPPSEYIAAHPPRGRAYLTQGSYFELSEWALPPRVAARLMDLHRQIKDQGKENEFYPFIKGGIWNNFLNKYPESNALNKRTLLLSREMEDLEKGGTACADAKRELYQGECNCAYWHGLFGGIYLNNLRHALHQHVLRAEGLLIGKKKTGGIEVLERDIWNEGSPQLLVRGNGQATVVVPCLGGAIAELGLHGKGFNIFNVVARRDEAYHDILRAHNEEENSPDELKSIHERVVVKEKGLKNYLVFDASRRYSFKDLVLPELPLPEDLMFGRAEFLDCGSLPYDYEVSRSRGGVMIDLSRQVQYRGKEITLFKRLLITEKNRGIKAEYEVRGGEGHVAVELNINLLAGHDADRYYEIPGVEKENSLLDGIGYSSGITSLALVDEYSGFRVVVASSQEASLLRYPIYTVSQSDAGFEKNFQGSALLLAYPLGGGPLRFEVTLTLEEF